MDLPLAQPCVFCESPSEASTESSLGQALAEPCAYCDEGPGSTTTAVVESDGDGLTESDELLYGADPANPDTDYDGIPDGKEIHVHGTFPWAADSDNDGDQINDYRELYVTATNPLSSDTDGDGYSDSDEVYAYYSDPNDPSDTP